MDYETGIRLDRIEQALAYLVKELEENKKKESKK